MTEEKPEIIEEVTPPVTPVVEPVEEPKKKTGLTIAIVLAVLFCICCIAAVAIAWSFGDQALDWLQTMGAEITY